VRQLWLVFVDGPRLDADARNPRHARTARDRGAIVARDGTPLAFTRDGKRIYPFGAALAHAVGYASTRYGTFGLEDSFDRVLTAPPQTGNPIAQAVEIATGTHRPRRGSNIITTLDVGVQRALVAGLAVYARAAGVVLDPRTGAVLALASAPSFDPNDLDAEFPGLLHDARSPLLDRVTSGLYPPGSTFKVVTAADAIDAGVVTPQTMFDDTGGFRIGDFTVHNDEEASSAGSVTPLAGGWATRSNSICRQHAIASRARAPSARPFSRSWASGKPRCWSRRCAWRSSRRPSPMLV